jgi:hypothetical protein
LIRTFHAPDGRENRPSTVKGPSPSAPASVILIPASAAAGSQASPSAPSSESRDALLNRLRFMAQVIRETRPVVHVDPKTGVVTGDEKENLARANRRHTEWRALREATYKDPATFFGFLRADENKNALHEYYLLIADTYVEGGPRLQYPKPFVDGLLDLIFDRLEVEHPTVNLSALSSIFADSGVQEAIFERVMRSLPSQDDPEVIRDMILALTNDNGAGGPARGPSGIAAVELRLDLLDEVWRKNSSRAVREDCLRVLLQTRSQAGEVLFREKLGEINRDHSRLNLSVPALLENLIGCLSMSYTGTGRDFAGRTEPGAEDRYIPFLKIGFSVTSDPSVWLKYASASLTMPLPKATTLLEGVSGSAPDADSKARVDSVLSQIRDGETKVSVLKGTLAKSPDKK